MWAVEQMNAGKKIRRSVWDSSEYINFTPGSESIYDEKKRNITICKIELTATDWEVFEEKKTLSDKIFQNRLEERDVKQALKEFFECFGFEYVNVKLAKKEAKRIFGERLLE